MDSNEHTSLAHALSRIYLYAMTPMRVMYVIVSLEAKTWEFHHNQETHHFDEKLDLSVRGYRYLVLVESCKHKMIWK